MTTKVRRDAIEPQRRRESRDHRELELLRNVTNDAENAANSAKAAKTRSISRLQMVTNPSQNSSISSHSQVHFLECCEFSRLNVENVATVRKVVSIYGKSGNNFGNGKLAILCRRCRPTGGFALVGGERHKGFFMAALSLADARPMRFSTKNTGLIVEQKGYKSKFESGLKVGRDF